MTLSVLSLGSGSTGNSYLISGDDTRILLDAGLSARKIVSALSCVGVDLEEIDAVCVTHNHIDHIRSIHTIAGKCENAKVYASRGTVWSCEKFEKIEPAQVEYIAAQEERLIGGIKVKAFGLSHDADEPIGFSFAEDGIYASVVTDTGIITDEICEEICASDLLALEANHEVDLLKMGSYPYYLKRRTLGDQGHLSNETAGYAILRMLEKRKTDTPPKVMLSHLSRENNMPEIALGTVGRVLTECGVTPGKDVHLGVASVEYAGDRIIHAEDRIIHTGDRV